MGNQICCQEVPKQHFDQPITVVYKVPPVVKPVLPPLVQANLQKNKPFARQLPLNPVLRQFGNDIYEGSLDSKGRPHGFGAMYQKNGSVFVGSFNGGIADGVGYYVRTDGSYYEGKMRNNKAYDDNGYFWSPNLQYKGQLYNNLFEGKGSQIGPSHEFRGKYRDGKKVSGIMNWREGNKQYEYQGDFNEQGNFEGKSKLIEHGSGVYIGDFSNGNKHGKGEYRFENGAKYVGEYYRNKKEGRGKVFNRFGKLAYEGQFKNGLPHGKGMAPDDKGELKSRIWDEGIDQLML